MKKKIIKSIIFVIIFFLLWKSLFSVLWLHPSPISEYYKEPKNSIDVAYFGASNAYAHFNTTLAYHEYGFTTAMLSSDMQPFLGIKFLMEEVKKKQDPEVYVVDISTAYIINLEEGAIRKITDAMKPSKNRNATIKYLLQKSDVKKEDYINYYFSFLTYHNVYNDLKEERYYDKGLFKGYLLTNFTIERNPTENNTWDNVNAKLEPLMEESLNDLINYIKDNKLNVLFVISPKFYPDDAVHLTNSITKKLEDNNFKVLNLDKIDEIGIDYEKDLYNVAHLNVWGSTKMTEYLSKYLNDNYDLKDHREDKKYKSWDIAYEDFKKQFKILTNEDFDDLVS